MGEKQMPHLRFRGVEAQTVQKLSASLPGTLASMIKSDEANFSFELIGTQFFSKGIAFPGEPFVEVWWFARSQEAQDQVALVITEAVRLLQPNGDIVVVFHPMPKDSYYENGSHF
jgi:phenylpyruvate tautomerase PptA (4-oxalocrotonate tautomerase family)